HPVAKVAGPTASHPTCAPGGESKGSPSSLVPRRALRATHAAHEDENLLERHTQSEMPSLRTVASLGEVDASVDQRGAEIDAAADALFEVTRGQRFARGPRRAVIHEHLHTEAADVQR